MVVFTYNNQNWYIDNKLSRNIDKKIIPDLKKRDKDVVWVIDGYERSGKSVYGQNVIAYILYKMLTPFNLSNICMTPTEFREKIKSSSKNECVIYDEAHRGMGSSSALSEVNKILKDLMMEMGQKNLLVIVILPTIFLLEKYVALFRAKGLFHVYEYKGRRGFWRYYNKRNLKKLYMKGKKEFNYNCMKRPGFKGRFKNMYLVPEADYREKKRLSFEKKERSTKYEKYLEQRNKLIRALFIESCGEKVNDTVRLCEYYKVGLKRTQIGDIIRKYREKKGK